MTDKLKEQVAAVKYSGVGAPTVIAKGEGVVAGRIKDLAVQHDIPLVQDAVLTNLLANVSLGDEIPESLYAAVSEVLAHIYRVGEAVDIMER